jgi:hypothetical protein
MNIFLSDDNPELEIFSSAVTLLTVSMYAALASLYQGIGFYFIHFVPMPSWLVCMEIDFVIHCHVVILFQI